MSDKQDVQEMMQDMPRPLEEAIQTKAGTYEVLNELGRGTFGAVFRVRRINDNKQLAMKCESCKARKQILKHEAKVFESLQKLDSPHFINIQDRGRVSPRFIFVVMKLIGKNLWDLRIETPHRRFSMVTSIRSAEQTLAAIRDLHTTIKSNTEDRRCFNVAQQHIDARHQRIGGEMCGYIHRDIKPPNFAIGRSEDGDPHTIYIIDFGLSRKYRTDDKDLRFQRERAAFRGTTRYASINALECKEQSRKDDIESWWYMVLEWMIGELPWRRYKGREREEVKKQKKALREETVLKLVLQETPQEYMANIILYIDTLEYASIPDYDHIAAQLSASMEAYDLCYADPPDWDLMVTYLGPRYEKNPHYARKSVKS